MIAFMMRKTGLFLAASTAASVTSALRPHCDLIHSLAIQVLISLLWNQKDDHPSDDRLLTGAGNRTWTCMKLLSLEPESSASANSAIPAEDGGQGWIRTIEVGDGRFTVCSLWPLGNLPTIFGCVPRGTLIIIYQWSEFVNNKFKKSRLFLQRILLFVFLSCFSMVTYNKLNSWIVIVSVWQL